MVDLVEPLEWDSAFFGVPIARVDVNGAKPDTLRAVDAEARAQGITCLYGTLEPADETVAYLLQTFGYRLVEVSINYERPGSPYMPRPSLSVVRPGAPADLPALEPAIGTVAAWSRYAADPRFGPDAARRMHQAWVERAARGTGDRALFVAHDESGITGMATFRRSQVPRIEFVGVTKPGTGVADALMCALFEWAERGPTEAGWTAARNIAVLRYVERWGFRANRTRYVFHRWLDETEGPS
jgi:dTDP-4-amino-4,6-dideoxy-D-galactose acyltransferase